MRVSRAQNPPDWQEILTYFRGSELQNFLTRILEDNVKAIIKPQYVDNIPKAVQGNVGEVRSSSASTQFRLCARTAGGVRHKPLFPVLPVRAAGAPS